MNAHERPPGQTFTPLTENEELLVKAPESGEPQKQPDRLRVLLVGDFEGIRDRLAATLSTTEYRPTIERIASGDDALSLVDESGFDAIVVGDTLVEGTLSGLEVLDRLSDIGERDPPVVFITNYDDASVINTAIERGANRCLPSHTGSDEWYQAVANAVISEVEDHRTVVELEQTRTHLRRILDTVPVMITRKNTENRLLTVNEAVVTYLDLPREEIEGKTAWDLFPEYGDAFYENDREVVNSGEAIRGEVQPITTPSGEDRWIKTDAIPYRDTTGEIDGVVIISEDITDFKEREQELARQNERLNAFTSVVSHDVRNPLTVAQGHLGLAAEECDSDHLAAVEDAHERIEVLIEKLLQLARGGMEVTDAGDVELSTVAEASWGNVETYDADLIITTDRIVHADQSRLKQVFENLFRNAVEHGGTDVTVRVGELADGFYVEDDGRGIPEHHRDEVFTAGYSTATDGTGFGLSIVEEIVDAHGWQVSVTARADGGTRFEVTGI